MIQGPVALQFLWNAAAQTTGSKVQIRQANAPFDFFRNIAKNRVSMKIQLVYFAERPDLRGNGARREPAERDSSKAHRSPAPTARRTDSWITKGRVATPLA